MSKRDDILTTALRLFNERGYQAVGVDTIRDEANVSKMTLYNHFQNKERLVEEVLKLRHKRFKESLEASLESLSSGSERLREIFNWHVSWFFAPDFFGCMFIRATGEFHGAQGMLAISREHKQWVAGLFETTFREMGLEQPARLARFFQTTLDGMIVNASLFHSFEAINEAWGNLCAHVGLAHTPLKEPGEIYPNASSSNRNNCR